MSRQWNITSFLSVLLILLLGFPVTADAQKLTIFVEEWPPYNFMRDGKVVGISTELIEKALQCTGVEYEIVLYPFKRALLTVQKTPNTMLYTVARIPEREDNFAWIGPLHPRKVYLYKLRKRSDIQINAIEDINKYRTGVLSGGSIEQFFLSNGIHKSSYDLVNKSKQLLKMLFAERIDLIPGDPLDLAYQMKELKLDYSLIEIAFFLADEGGYYMVANKNTSPRTLEEIQNALQELLTTGARDQIIREYLK